MSREEQLQACQLWISGLESLREENALLIHLLAGALSDATNTQFIESAENYQGKLLLKEEALVLLRHEVREQLLWLNAGHAGQAPHVHASLAGDIRRMEEEFMQLRQHFLIFLENEKEIS
ncbi:hypothetical protein [Chitinophaga vietnamensis]|uniref:hypothetical protein n=1 Tax=Chitinophaga vietnamensis TaxID=2593957 RepID=UPI001178C857|nr:hypothetical protein [Chitinophaga vietnamensis]